MKTPVKFILGGAVLALIGGTAIYGSSYWRQYQITDALKALEAPYREDIYGGKTPEETFDMFLGALEKDDLELASRYFIVRKQDAYRERLEKMRSDGILEKQIQEWKRARNEWEKVVDEYNSWETHATVRYFTFLEKPVTKNLPDGAGGYIEHTFPPGKYANDIVFDTNELTRVWKITSL